MEANKILTADVLDIIFEGRNKDYGAYDLRKTYDRRLITAFTVMVSAIGVLITGYVLAGKFSATDKAVLQTGDHTLVEIIEPPVVEPPPLVIPKPIPQRVEMTRFTPPVIIQDDQVKETDKPPLVETLVDTKIGTITRDGAKDDGIVAPPVGDNGKGIVAPPQKKEEDIDIIFERVEIESAYPGGAGAWMRYLNKTIRYPEQAQTIELQGTVIVQFIVDQEGKVSNVEVISGPSQGGLGEEAIRVIKNSGKWEPAIQNGRKVKSYKKQPIIFKLSTE